MKYDSVIYRNKDLIYGNEDLEHLHTFKNFPVFMGCVTSDKNEDRFCDLSFYISKKSGMIQLNPLLSLNDVYKYSHGSGTTGATWNQHHLLFSNFISKFFPKNVLEIGGYKGILAKNCQSVQSELEWTIIDPNSYECPHESVNKINGFFDETFVSSKKYDTIIHSHLLEHVYDINHFLEMVKSSLNDDGLMIFSVPNIKAWIDQKFTNSLTFEHTYYIADYYIEYFLSKFNFKILEKQYFKDSHSIFYCAKISKESEKMILSDNLYDINKKIFEDYISHNLNLSRELNKKLDTYKNHNVYLFGAHIFSQYLIAYGLNIDNVICLLDNDVSKKDKRLYGTRLISKLPITIKNDDKPVVILKCGSYNTEIKENILKNINSTTIFLE